MKILAIETSCDETSAAIIEDGKKILSNVVASQVEFHKKYGGVVPEVASRKHTEVINLVIKQALEKAKTKFSDLDAIAVTYGPGLVGALLVGICAAKTLAYSLKIPFIPVNHIEGHIYANFISVNSKSQSPNSKQITNNKFQTPKFPFIALIVSGGHTQLVKVIDHGKYEVLGSTRDDAAGEAFDKVARFLDLGYPGGPIIDKMAKKGNSDAVSFTKAKVSGYDFSFSGIKTAVVNYVRHQNEKKLNINKPDLAASFQKTIVDMLLDKTFAAAKKLNIKIIALAGGVSANSLLREELETESKKQGIKTFIPPVELCTDNAAMIACAGYYKLKGGIKSNLDIRAVSGAKL